MAGLLPLLGWPRLGAGAPQGGQLLTVTLPLVVAGLVAELVDHDLGALAVVDDLGRDGGLAECRSVAGHRAGVVNEQHSGQRQRLAGRRGHAVDLERVADGNLVLMAASADDRVHSNAPQTS